MITLWNDKNALKKKYSSLSHGSCCEGPKKGEIHEIGC